MSVNSNDSFIEKRKITLVELYILMILEDMASHGINESIAGYTIDLIYLGKRGIFRILCKGNSKLLIGRRYPPRIRKFTESNNSYDY